MYGESFYKTVTPGTCLCVLIFTTLDLPEGSTQSRLMSFSTKCLILCRDCDNSAAVADLSSLAKKFILHCMNRLLALMGRHLINA